MMGKSFGKIKRYEIVLCVLLLAVIVAGLFLPKSGPLVLLDELCDIFIIWVVCIYVIARIIQNRKTAETGIKTAGAILAVICAAVCLWFTRDIAADLVSGPKTAALTEVEVRQSQAHTGIFSHHYYLTGTDPQGKRIRVEISAGDYAGAAGTDSVTLVYYEHTGRTVSVH